MQTWYTIEKSNGEYTVWMNKSNKKERINFIKKKGIKVEK